MSVVLPDRRRRPLSAANGTAAGRLERLRLQRPRGAKELENGSFRGEFARPGTETGRFESNGTPQGNFGHSHACTKIWPHATKTGDFRANRAILEPKRVCFSLTADPQGHFGKLKCPRKSPIRSVWQWPLGHAKLTTSPLRPQRDIGSSSTHAPSPQYTLGATPPVQPRGFHLAAVTHPFEGRFFPWAPRRFSRFARAILVTARADRPRASTTSLDSPNRP